MRFKAKTYDRDVDRLLDELLDDETIARYGSEHVAYEAVGLLLGVWAGDVIAIDENGYVILPDPPEEIDRLIAIAREGRARGESIWSMAGAGKFESDRDEKD